MCMYQHKEDFREKMWQCTCMCACMYVCARRMGVLVEKGLGIVSVKRKSVKN